GGAMNGHLWPVSVLVAAFEGGTQDIAQRSARIRAAILFDGFFFFGDFARLDRQAQTAGLGVDVGDADINLVADLEACGALVLTVAGEVPTTDEGLHAVVFDLDAAIFDRRHGDGDDRATLDAFDSLGHRVVFKRFDRERDALFLDVNFLNDGFHHIALAEVLDGFLAAGIPADVRKVDHAVDIAFEANEQTEFGDVLDFAFDDGADRMGFGKDFPRVAHGLLETQADATLGFVDLQHHDVDFLRGRDDLAGMDVFLGPA